MIKHHSLFMHILKWLIVKIDGCKSNPENSSTAKVGEHISSGFSISIISSFKSIENKNDVYRDKDCMKKFYRFLRDSALKIINSKKKNMKLLTNERQNSYQN